jgi:tetraacyldisaccharide 4'-kinase
MGREWLAPLTPSYWVGLAAKNAVYDAGWLRAERLRWPVASVGNLSVGGSGKTPLTIRLAELLKADGLAVDVLSRGYGRSSTATERVDPGGDAGRFGDEPLLIARRAGVPVFVGASRYKAGLLAEASAGEAAVGFVHLLDDGFQHRQLARDVDIVVLHRSDFTETLLPAGRLREPLEALRRADFVALREEDAEFEGELRRRGIAAPAWWMRRSVEVATKVERAVAFCGVARPEEFFASLAKAGVSVTRKMAFADHHRYSEEDARRLAEVCVEAGGDGFVTTEKDLVKLDASVLGELERVAPLVVARLTVGLRDEAAVAGQLRAKLLAR